MGLSLITLKVSVYVEKANYDLICIGGGGAAILAAINAAAAGLNVALVTKEYPGFGNTRLAVGLAACPGLLAADTSEKFAEDLINSGEGISEREFVQNFSKEAATYVEALENLGPIFRRDENGMISDKIVERTGGHSLPRSISNYGGGVLLGASLKCALWRYGVNVYSQAAALELIKVDNKVCGLLGLSFIDRSFIALKSKMTLIASGGCGALYYPHSTNSRGAVGGGLALALKAGAVLWDMEQIQAIPFGLTRPRSMIGALCGEPSTAGPAGQLLDGRGNVLLEAGINKMTRAEVTRVMMEVINDGQTDPYGGLALDLRPNLKLKNSEQIYKSIRSSGIFDIVKTAYGLDAYRWEEPWSVMPTFHFQLGGIRVNYSGETGVRGLLAAGEIRAGLHGGNRLGSVALSEVYMTGSKAGRYSGSYISKNTKAADLDDQVFEAAIEKPSREWKALLSGQGRHNPIRLRSELERLMWQMVGPVREENSLLEALSVIDRLTVRSKDLAINTEKVLNRQLLDAVELNMILPAARAVVLSALERCESRGAHLRSDYPDRNDRDFKCHTYIEIKEDGSFKSGLEPLIS